MSLIECLKPRTLSSKNRVPIRTRIAGGFIVGAFMVLDVLAATTPYRLSKAPLSIAEDVSIHYEISPDGNYVVYFADHDLDNVFELYSVPITGGTPIKLNHTLLENQTVNLLNRNNSVLQTIIDDEGAFKISPDSSRVLFLSNIEFQRGFDLYSVPITGGTPVKLNGPLPRSGIFSGDVDYVVISPDSSTVVYQADQDTYRVAELYSVPIGGGTSIKLNPTPPEFGDVFGTNLQVSSDNQYAVMIGDVETNGVFEIYSAKIDGSTFVRLNQTLPASGQVDPNFRLTPDGSRVIYLADIDTDEVDELYSVPIGGGMPVKLNDGLLTTAGITHYTISADSQSLVYLANQDSVASDELYSVPVTGGTPIKLNQALGSTADVLVGFKISPDSSQVSYVADAMINDTFELFSVPIGGGTPVSLSGPLVIGGDVKSDISISPDSSSVLFRADKDTDNLEELYLVPIAGGEISKLSGNLISNGDISDSQSKLTPDSSKVLYLADQSINGQNELFAANADGSDNVKLNRSLPEFADVDKFLVSVTSNHIVYLADQNRFGQTELYAVDISDLSATIDDICFPIVAANQKIALICL